MGQVGDTRHITDEEWEALDLQQLEDIEETLAKLADNVRLKYMNQEYADQLAAPLIARRQVLRERHKIETR